MLKTESEQLMNDINNFKTLVTKIRTTAEEVIIKQFKKITKLYLDWSSCRSRTS